MAWTTPRTWVTDELVTAALMNSHVRDNLNSTWHLLARKTADQSVTSSTTLVDDTHLLLTVAASEVWALEYRLRFTGATTGDLKFAWTFPTGGEVEFAWSYLDTTNTATTDLIYATTSPSSANSVAVPNASPNVNPITIGGFYVGGANAGTVTLQWAQDASSGTATTMKANSILMGMKLA